MMRGTWLVPVMMTVGLASCGSGDDSAASAVPDPGTAGLQGAVDPQATAGRPAEGAAVAIDKLKLLDEDAVEPPRCGEGDPGCKQEGSVAPDWHGRGYWGRGYWGRGNWGHGKWGHGNWGRGYWGRGYWGRGYWGRGNRGRPWSGDAGPDGDEQGGAPPPGDEPPSPEVSDQP